MAPETLLAIKVLHITLVATSGTGFLLRGLAMLRGSPLLNRRWVRIAPHVIDTGVLLSGSALAVGFRFAPVQHPWLALKLGLLIAYVIAGMLALRRGKTRRTRALAFAVALVLFAWMAGIALTHRPLVFS